MARDRQSRGKPKAGAPGGAAERSRAGTRSPSRGGSPSPIMLAAAVVVVVGALALFWPRGGSTPAGIGEHQTTVTVDGDSVRSQATGRTQPRSGDVDIDQQVRTLVPEQPGDSGAAPATKPAATSQSGATQTRTTPPPSPAATPATRPGAAADDDRVEPAASGPYVVQVAAFGAAENADREAARLQALGWDARVRTGTNSSGAQVYRVWIGYFASRTEARRFISQSGDAMADAIAVKQ